MKNVNKQSKQALSAVMVMWAIVMLTLVGKVQSQTLSASISSHTNVSCFGGHDGTATVTASGGTPSYTYLWSTSPAQTLATATGLSIGTYTVTVTDAVASTSTASVTITQPTAILVNCTVIANVSCYGLCNGAISVSSSGGTPSYNYVWNTTPVQVTQTITGICAGTYTVTVTDANGCIATGSATITQPSAIVLSITSFTNVSCYGGCNGTATVSASGGTPPYASYAWDGGETTPTVTGLCAGTYTVTVTDANGCTKSITVTITQPSQIYMTTANVDSATCYGSCNGSITANVSGGTPGYSYIWNTGLPGNVASNLCAGTYTCTVTDANGCRDSIKATVLQPLIMTSYVSNADTILPCYGLNNGTITIYVVGGTPPFTEHWNTGATGMTINNLSGGIYTDTITGRYGCRVVRSVTVSQPPAISIHIDSINPSCMYACDGQISATVSGGTPFSGGYYEYYWNTHPPQYTASITGLCAGTYNLTLTDSNGCHKIVSVYLGSNDSIYPSFTASPTSSSSPWVVNFTYTGAVFAANIYSWFFGDGGTSNLENPTHTYATFATYDVWLYVYINDCGTDSCHTFIGPASLGKPNTAINDLISIYPNPVTDNLQLKTDLKIETMEIADITGRLLFTTTSKTIDCSSLSNGLYFVRIITDKGIGIKKFVKE